MIVPRRSSQPLAFRWAAACVAMLALVRVTLAGGGWMFDAARLVPDDVDVFIVLEDAKALRRGEMGPAASALIERVFAGGETEAAWTALADRLGWDRDEAFDRLLGHRVAFVARLGDDGATWALLSEVSLDTEKRLRERLDVAPRAIVAGHTVLSVERGAYELTAERRAKHATLIFAPTARNALFDELIPQLEKGAKRALHDADAFRRLREIGAGQALLYMRPPDKDGWTGLVARRMGMTIHADLAGGAPAEAACDVRPWRVEGMRAAAKDAIFWCVERAASETITAPRMTTLFSGLPIARLHERATETVGEFMTVWVAPTKGGGLPSVAAGLELLNLECAPATADGLMADLLDSVGMPGMNFTGVPPEAVRRVDLAHAPMIHDSGLWKTGPELRWTFADASDDAPARSWWVMGLEAPGFEMALDALSREADDGEARSWLSVGAARPALALKTLQAAGLKPEGPALAASLVRELAWGVEVVDGQRLRGILRAELLCPADHPKPQHAR